MQRSVVRVLCAVCVVVSGVCGECGVCGVWRTASIKGGGKDWRVASLTRHTPGRPVSPAAGRSVHEPLSR